MSRGIIEAQTLRTEQFEFEARTSDPADAQPGEYWIRTDQTSSNPDIIAQLRRQDTSGVTTAPIFASAEESNLGTDVVRGPSVVLDDGSVGFVAMTNGGGALGSPRAVTSSGTQYVSHDGLELNPIHDTLVSRPADDGSFDGNSDARGLRIETSQKWEQIQAKISSNTGSGTTTAYLQKTDQTVIQTVDISSLGAGDIVTFDQANLTDNTKYDILLDADSSTYQYGQYTSASYPYTSNDGNLKMTTGVTGGGSGLQDSIAFSYVDIGNITL